MSKRVHFSIDSKDFDGCRKTTEECYKLINAFFNKSTIYHKKIGKTQDEIDSMLESKSEFGNNSYYIKNFIKAKKTGECDILLPIKTSSDCFDAVNGDMKIINYCIENLRNALENLRLKQIDKIMDGFELDKKRFLEKDDEWDKTCDSDICYNKKCCYEKKIQLNKRNTVSLIRSGGRDCNLTFPAEYSIWIEKFLNILQESVKVSVPENEAMTMESPYCNDEIMT
jgi:hypothetical protein